jgi:hypothetical protein
MATNSDLMAATQPPPGLNIPPSSKTVAVRIDTTAVCSVNPDFVVAPHIDACDTLHVPSFSFLISHGDHHILFDLGIRKDFMTGCSPRLIEFMFGGPKKFMDAEVDKNVCEILDEDHGNLGIESKDMNAVIWSHHYWDHIGDITTLPGAELVIGPGF